jgi:hypothetical protein
MPKRKKRENDDAANMNDDDWEGRKPWSHKPKTETKKKTEGIEMNQTGMTKEKRKDRKRLKLQKGSQIRWKGQ